jgi:adenylate kinase
MIRKKLRAVIFGPQGSGKGTQASLLGDRYGISVIGAGDLCRAEIAEETSLGKLVRQYVERGMLAPDELIDALVARQMKTYSLDKGFILDGYPRNVEQAKTLGAAVDINLAIQLKLSDEVALSRLLGRLQCSGCRSIFHESNTPLPKLGICPLCGSALHCRLDDREDIIRLRLAEYHFMTEPLAAYYRQKGVLLAVNADQSIQTLFEELQKKMEKLGFKI